MRVVIIARSFVRYAGLWLFVASCAGAVLSWFVLVSPLLIAYLWSIGFICLVVDVVLGPRMPIIRGTALVVAAPVRGRWRANNSPASKIPSHGGNWGGQTYAVDLLFSPDGPDCPFSESTRLGFRPPEEFRSFGEPVFAAADGVVVRMHDGERDHRTRLGKGALRYLKFEQFVRALGGPSRLLGNHLVIRLSDGSHLVYAHLRRGSLRVSLGGNVSTGDVIAACGNSGNTTQPHLYIQRQDAASILMAMGLPWAIERAGDGGTRASPQMERAWSSIEPETERLTSSGGQPASSRMTFRSRGRTRRSIPYRA
jgi:hypothetical protein